jgi:ACS family tartrate transporter-like MFS transporter
LPRPRECRGIPTSEALYRKVSLRLIPFMMLLLFLAILDRVNIGFAALTMNDDLGLSPYVFGWGAGIFFFGYFMFEVPSNVVLEKVGARWWIARIMVTWGLVATAMIFVQGPVSFFVLRFLLGVAEAGFFPGMVLYLSYWFPAAHRANIAGLFIAAVPMATVIGGPISALLVAMDETLGLKGWQWLFIVEGVPSFVLGFAVLWVLPNGPDSAKWLSAEERAIIHADLKRERELQPVQTDEGLWQALSDPRVIVLGLAYMGIVVGMYGVGLWLPQIVKAMGFSTVQVGYVVALPYAFAAAAMMLWGRHSDSTGERIWHVSLAAGLAAVGLVGSVYLASPLMALGCLGLATVGIYAILGPFWALPPIFLRGTAAAGGIALINSVGSLGGFVGPYLVGWIKQSTGSFSAGMGALAIAVAASAILVPLLSGTAAARR